MFSSKDSIYIICPLYGSFLWITGVLLWPRMGTKGGVRPDEGLMMMQELDDRLKEQIDKLEHVRLAAVELKDNLSGVRLACNESSSIIKTVLLKPSILTWCSSHTEQQWSYPFYRRPSGVVKTLVRASGDSTHEHNCFCSGEKHIEFLMGSFSFFFLRLGNTFLLHFSPDESQASCMGRETGFQTWLPPGTSPPGRGRPVGVWLVPHPHTTKQWCCLWNVL